MTTTIRDVMTSPAVSVTPETPLSEVARQLVERRISGMPVVDEAGTVVGVVSEADFLIKDRGPDAIPRRPLARLLGESSTSKAMLGKVNARTAGEAMTAPPVTVDARRSVAHAATLMIERGVNRLPVIDQGHLVGVVTRADLVRAHARSDEELRSAVREEVIRRILWLDPDLFDVSVQDGVARIEGRVERRSTAEMMDRVVLLVPGVVAVVTDVSWEHDDANIEVPQRDLVSPFRNR